MSEPFIGEIRMVGFNFAPTGWALCNGQLMSIAQNQALFALLGTTYGGDGVQTFALPDLRGRVPMHFGQGPGLTPRTQGEKSGSETVTLLQNQMPAHNHLLNAAGNAGNTTSPQNALPAASGDGSTPYSTANPDTTMNPLATGITGGSQPHENMPPYLVVNFIISLNGIFPSRP